LCFDFSEENKDSAQNVDVGSQEYDQGIKDEVCSYFRVLFVLLYYYCSSI
jgi:hypothetical protein